MIELSPNVVDVVEYQLPESVRATENALFVTFLKYYYQWLIQRGQPAEFISDIINYTDIDLASGDFKNHLTQILLKFVPASANVNLTVLSKHLTEFLRSKGTFESFQFIMRAVYGEEIEMTWNADHLFRPSANSYSRKAFVYVDSNSNWTGLVEGSKLIQTSPSSASATIESVTSLPNVIKLELDSKSIEGLFINNGSVQVLKNTINRNHFEVKNYYTNPKIISNSIQFYAVKEESRPYQNMIIRQINSNFRAVITGLNNRLPSTDLNIVTVNITTVTGSLTADDLYIIPPEIENLCFTKADYLYSTVSNSITDIKVDVKGSLYNSGDEITFLNGNGHNVNAFVSELGSGSVTQVEIVNKGYGYSVGDQLVSIEETGGSGFVGTVSAIDGQDANIQIISELNTFSIVNGGNNFKVNDELEIADGVLVAGTPPTRFRVTSVNSSWFLSGLNLVSGGYNYPSYSKLALVDTSTNSIVSGFLATPVITAGTISQITLNTAPTISSSNLIVTVNGYGATASNTIVSGSISTISIVNGGVNFIDPVIDIIGDGSGAFATAIQVGGVVSAITLNNGGTGYTSANIVIRERNGSGASIVPLIQNNTTGEGSVTGLTILNRGLYTSLPKCEKVMMNVFRNGSGILLLQGGYLSALSAIDPINGHILSLNVSSTADIISGIFSFDFRANSANLLNSGQYYHSVSTSASGNGTGAILYGNQVGGVITNVTVINGGSNYFYGTTVSMSGGSTPCSLTPVISDGSIVSVTVNSGGTGYSPPEMSNFTINSGSNITLTTTISGTGRIVNSTVLNAGSGYNSQSETTPISITASIGTNAKFIPSISTSGTIVSVDVIDGGSGYTASSVITVTGTGSYAQLKPVVFNGKITNIIVQNGGQNYKYGTSCLILGDGLGADIVPIVETGITSVSIINSGSNYADTTAIIVSDISGSGADIRPVIVNGKITDIIIASKGTGYRNPILTLNNVGYGSSAVIGASAERFISSLNIVSAGSGYTYAEATIIGDGSNASFLLTAENLGTIGSVAISNQGSGYTSTPVITVSDNSGFGSVSKVSIQNGGSGYTKLPVITLPNKYNSFGTLIGSGTKFICYGDNIGSINGVSFIDSGYAYTESPLSVFGFNAILKQNAAFKVGEQVKIVSGQYRDALLTTSVLLETGFNLLNEDGSIIKQDIDDQFYDSGVTATVESYDFSRNQIELIGLSDDFYIIGEDGSTILTENESILLNNVSGTFSEGDVIIGSNSNATSTILKLSRASGHPVIGGIGFTQYSFDNAVGMFNNKSSVIADNFRFQDKAYVIKCGRGLSDYIKTLKDTVHPTGFALFGDVYTQAEVESNVLNEIGYNPLTILLLLYSIVLDGFTAEFSSMDELFGELAKFNHSIPVGLVSDNRIGQTSIYSIATITQYQTPQLFTSDLSLWTSNNGLSMIQNYGSDPLGTNNLTQITDFDTINTSFLSRNLTTVLGHSYVLETYIKKQINPLMFLELAIGTNYLRLNTETQNFYTNAVNYNIVDLGDYLWVRLFYTANSTSTLFSISPAKGFVSDLTIVSNSAVGSIELYATNIRDITSATAYSTLIRAKNSTYENLSFNILSTETDLTIH
jgi:hypothetical protein